MLQASDQVIVARAQLTVLDFVHLPQLEHVLVAVLSCELIRWLVLTVDIFVRIFVTLANFINHLMIAQALLFVASFEFEIGIDFMRFKSLTALIIG